jgi:rubrerythrin
MAMTFLKKVEKLDKLKSVKYHLHAHLGDYEPDRPKKLVHASELTKEDELCPREYALTDVLKTKPARHYLSTSENVTYTMGRVLQDLIADTFAEIGKAIGHWRCQACSHLHEFQSRPLRCEKCGFKVFKSEEVRFQSALSGASCGIDLLLAMGEPKLRPVEIKTMDKEQFKTLVAPLAEHKLRTTYYLRLIAESDHSWATMVSTERSTILYVSKGGYGCQDDTLKGWGLRDQFSPFKEFTVERNDAMTEALHRRAKVVKDFRDGKVGMPHGLCSTALSKRAKYCPQRTACFSGEHPPVYNWKGGA